MHSDFQLVSFQGKHINMHCFVINHYDFSFQDSQSNTYNPVQEFEFNGNSIPGITSSQVRISAIAKHEYNSSDHRFLRQLEVISTVQIFLTFH